MGLRPRGARRRCSGFSRHGVPAPAFGRAIACFRPRACAGRLERKERFAAALDAFARALPLRPVLLGNVCDPTFGDDARVTRATHARVNRVVAEVAPRHGTLLDLHSHFLRDEPIRFTRTIKLSLIGATESRSALSQQL